MVVSLEPYVRMQEYHDEHGPERVFRMAKYSELVESRDPKKLNRALNQGRAINNLYGDKEPLVKALLKQRLYYWENLEQHPFAGGFEYLNRLEEDLVDLLGEDEAKTRWEDFVVSETRKELDRCSCSLDKRIVLRSREITLTSFRN